MSISIHFVCMFIFFINIEKKKNNLQEKKRSQPIVAIVSINLKIQISLD